MVLVGTIRVHKGGFISIVSGTLFEGDTFNVEGVESTLTEDVVVGDVLRVGILPRRTHCVAVYRNS